MLENIIPLIASYFSTNIAGAWLWYVIGLAFLATVPVILRQLIQWR